MVLAVVLDTGEEGALDTLMGGYAMVVMNMAMLISHVNWGVELRVQVCHMVM